jgi:hypothetical protein
MSWEDSFCKEKIHVEYLECKTVTVCVSRSIARRRLVERENLSACAMVDCKLCKREITLYCLCKCNYEWVCNQLLINPIIWTRTCLISGVHITVWRAVPFGCDTIQSSRSSSLSQRNVMPPSSMLLCLLSDWTALNHEDGGSTFLCNPRELLPDYTASHSTRQLFFNIPMISNIQNCTSTICFISVKVGFTIITKVCCY